MPSKPRKPRVPTLKFTKNRNIGWHVSFRDPETGMPRKHRFGMVTPREAQKAYYEWVAAHLGGQTPNIIRRERKKLSLESAAVKSQDGADPTEALRRQSSPYRFRAP